MFSAIVVESRFTPFAGADPGGGGYPAASNEQAPDQVTNILITRSIVSADFAAFGEEVRAKAARAGGWRRVEQGSRSFSLGCSIGHTRPKI